MHGADHFSVVSLRKRFTGWKYRIKIQHRGLVFSPNEGLESFETCLTSESGNLFLARKTGEVQIEHSIDLIRYKSILGDRLRARSRGGRVAESVVACNVLNQMTELGRPESYSSGR